MNIRVYHLVLAFILLVILPAIGWVANICQILAVSSAPVTGLFIIKCIGVIVAPLGAVLGWIGMF